jgi:hypothetical protein
VMIRCCCAEVRLKLKLLGLIEFEVDDDLEVVK